MNNTVILVGRLVKDIEVRYTTEGIAISEFTLAVTRSYKDKNTGNYEADFIKVQVWRNTAETMSKYCQKGDMVGVKGEWKHENYEDKDGNKRSKDYVLASSVTFLQTNKKEEKEEKLNCVEVMETVTKDPFEEFANETQNPDLPF